MVLLVLPANIENAPYIQIYIDLFIRNNIDFEVIYWDKQGYRQEYSYKTYVFDGYVGGSYFSKLTSYMLFSKFVKTIVLLNKYDLIIVFTLQSAMFLRNFLVKRFSNRYIVDIRDYSVLISFCRRSCEKIFCNSKMNIVSSRGFFYWLPNNVSYNICHNLPWNFSGLTIKEGSGEKIVVLTIGQLRDYSTNVWLISQLKNINGILLQFSGNGIAKEKLENYVKNDRVLNTQFTGLYNKEDEGNIVNEADIINIILPNNLLSNTLMSNRFYLALLYRKPMLVNAYSEHAKYVKKYKLGLVVEESTNLYDRLMEFMTNYNRELFCRNCELLLNMIKKENSLFAQKLLNIASNK